VAIFLFLAALDHLLCALPGIDRWYIANLGRGTNPLRWWEYSVSASLMIVLIALVSSVQEVTALIAIAGANVGMILFGLAMEHRNPAGTERVDWRPFIYGCITGVFPWIAIGIVLIRAQIDAGVPAAIWAIYISLFVLFFTFALNMWLHYARKGRWAGIVPYEKTYLVLSLVAKSLLAWQIFASALAG
ncbi:MAG: heliorhodopsin HeR, partial [Miltoncostaeaceae bacterium]